MPRRRRGRGLSGLLPQGGSIPKLPAGPYVTRASRAFRKWLAAARRRGQSASEIAGLIGVAANYPSMLALGRVYPSGTVAAGIERLTEGAVLARDFYPQRRLRRQKKTATGRSAA